MNHLPIACAGRSTRLRRLAFEVVAAVLSPTELGALAILPALPYTAAVAADVERTRAYRLGAERAPMRTTVGSLARWALARSRTRAAWRHDLTILLTSLMIGLLGLASLVTLGLGGTVLACAPILSSLGLTPVLGSWTGDDAAAVTLMTLLGVAALLVEAAILLGLSHLRDAALRLLDDRDEDRRAVVQLAAVRTNRAAVLDSFEQERRRIERDLHDGPQQNLVALSITLGMLEREVHLQSGDAERLQELASRAHQLADQSLSSLRQTVHSVHPRELSDLGLFASLQELTARSPLTVELAFEGTDVNLAPATASAAYYLVSEALTNVMKHSGTSTAHVEIVRHPDRLVVTVIDRGSGGATPREGRGISGLLDRVAALDGHLEVTSPAGSGTTITAVIPTPGRQGEP